MLNSLSTSQKPLKLSSIMQCSLLLNHQKTIQYE